MTSTANIDEDVIMHSNDSGAATPTPLIQNPDPPPDPESLSRNRSPTPVAMKDTIMTDTIMADDSASASSLDLLDRINGMFRLLDLVPEQSSNGVVDKVLIAQESVKQFANFIHPGSYRSEIQVDFRALDTHTIKPKGLYGSMSAIVDFLQGLGCIDDETRDLLLYPRDEYSGVSRPSLRPGLYALCSPNLEENLTYIIFWPEDATWQDEMVSSASRNRVTFMRYLTKLCDQVVCLISDEHSARLVWKDEIKEKVVEDNVIEPFAHRMFGFTVEQTNEEEEGATENEGFNIIHSSINLLTNIPPNYLPEIPVDALRSQIVVGETNQAILQPRFLSGEVVPVPFNYRLMLLGLQSHLSEKMSPKIIIANTLDSVGLHILLEKGNLWARCGSLRQEWESQKKESRERLEEDRRGERTVRRAAVIKDKEMLDRYIATWLVKQAAKHYPLLSEYKLFQEILGEGSEDEVEKNCEMAITQVESWFENHKDLAQKFQQEVQMDLQRLDTEQKGRYLTMKRRTLRIIGIIYGQSTSDGVKDPGRLVELVTIEKNFKEELEKRTALPDKQRKSGRFSSFLNGAAEFASYIPVLNILIEASRKKDISSKPSAPHPIPTLPQQDDFAFATLLQTIKEDGVFNALVKDFKVQMVELLKEKIKMLSSTLPLDIQESLNSSIDKDISQIIDERRREAERLAEKRLKQKVHNCLSNSASKVIEGPTLQIDSISQASDRYNGRSTSDLFLLSGVLLRPTRAGFEYTLHPFDIKSGDLEKIATNEYHICKPVIRSQVPPPFFLPLQHHLRYIKLLEKDRCLAVIENSSSIYVYLETFNGLASAIDSEKSTKKFHVEKTGKQNFFAVDEGKKLFVMVSIFGTSISLHVYVYDSDTRSFGARGSAINLTLWFQGTPSFSHLLFITGTEELLLVEKSGSCRIFSLVTQNFRLSTLHVEGEVEAAFSSPDGSCLFLKTISSNASRIICYHWASFGGSTGKAIPWPDHTPAHSQMVVSSVGTRNSTHLIFLTPEENRCNSLHIRISRKSSEFAFRSTTRRNNLIENPAYTINNSLIDCHAEVWTRFPVQPPISRETNASAVHRPHSVTFVSTAPSTSFPLHFSTMVKDFEYNTRKPTKGSLAQIRVNAQDYWDPKIATSTTELQVGDWLVGLFCLIPIHLAITESNRFVPLKDGMISPQFEQSLLGANVAQISEELSFGWYESIFNSYLASKPVKVITSMGMDPCLAADDPIESMDLGEQSVGKSFALNHFVDTSFAGSAMRCTEGVWLSVTPTRDYLVVAMDFEGVHSIERSAQEDTLLVLLNAAISNLVLFRNNFALSRDIAGLFTSFQSCTKVLDPSSNPSLFHSTLGIIIKDVIDSDTKEIVNEFSQKFQRIVRQERGDNFITKLHKGNLDIIPWPVIQSTQFYDLFHGLKGRLDGQPITHSHAGAFINVLKMLMAKLKANDWGALDQNLASQRSHQLDSVILFALSLGTTDPVTGEQLKNYDTDETLKNDDTSSQFYLEEARLPIAQSISSVECLKRLRKGWPDRVLRFTISESDFLQRFNTYLSGLAERRIEHVSAWLKANTSRFGENPEILGLFRRFDGLKKDIRRSVELCGSKCSSCGLFCLDHKQHDGGHNCMTTHRCPEGCGFTEQHDENFVPACDLPAGHSGRHVCTETPHLCSMPCHLYGKNGCLERCTKPMGHDDDEGHLCAASVHTCGELCSLVKDGTQLCTRPCVVDCRREHKLHSCDRALSCPLKCQLCNSFCAVGDHFHALQIDPVHLCGQPHACTRLCELPGICEIATTPQSIESTFIGRHARFQYTRYTQEARRLHCVISIDSDKLDHDSPHVHSKDPTAFHFCKDKCRHCEYYCTLPLNHRQNEHETSHGSMSKTEWVIEGDSETTLELEGHKYATGDNGAPMLCSMLCKSLGRHVHIDACRPDGDGNCAGAGIQHAKGRKGQDWITHRLFWARSGFRDPYTQTEQADFDLCDHRCGGEEHDSDKNPGAVASPCTFPMFHPPADPANPPALGHISSDGHSYNCKNPILMQRSFHIFFVLDSSGSMGSRDRQPLLDTPATQRIAAVSNNRFGAVISSLYSFWTARDTAIQAGAAAGLRRDAYSIITFASNATVTLADDTTSSPDELLDLILANARASGGTSYTAALKMAQERMEATWITERSPVIIFLSDGQCEIADETVYDLCHTAVRLGKPLAFHSVSFGPETYSHSLRRMASIAGEVYDRAPRDPLASTGVNPCTFNSALDTVQLATTFLGFAESLKNPRAALSRF